MSDETLSPQAAETMAQLVRSAAAAYGDSTAIVLQRDDHPDEAMSFAELDAESARIAKGLIARGVGKGSRVGFIFANGPMFATLFAAIGRIGAIAIPISTMIRSNELVRVLRQSDLQGLIIQREQLGKDYVERLFQALPELADSKRGELRIARVPYMRWVVSSGRDLPDAVGGMDWLTDAGTDVSDEMLLEIESEVHPTDQLVEIYTSGSMALPKGVRHLHGSTLFRTHWLVGMLGPQRGKEAVAMLPMFWVGGLMMALLPNWEVGAITVCAERTLNNSRVAMGSVLADEDLKLMQNNKPYWGLGMSETLGPYSWGDEFRAEGRPVCAPMDHFAPGYEVRIADENNRQVGDGEVGEMQLRGLPVTAGLHKIARDAFFTPDGFYRTGDMCLVDGPRIHFVGRDGDMIKTAGSNVSPAEVELEMQQLDGIHSAFVVGLPDKERGQLLVAAVVPRDGATLDFSGIEGALRQRLSSYKVPRAYVAITRDEIPMLHSNKVARRQIATMMAERLGRA